MMGYDVDDLCCSCKCNEEFVVKVNKEIEDLKGQLKRKTQWYATLELEQKNLQTLLLQNKKLKEELDSIRKFTVDSEVQANKITELKIEIENLKGELIQTGAYKTNPDTEGCICPKFYKDTGTFAGINYYCPIHGR